MKYVIGLMLASLSMFTYAQRTPLACQVDRSAGLNWEEGKWNVRSFTPSEKFILVREGNLLTSDSVAKAIGRSPANMKCVDVLMGDIMCTNQTGFSMFFSLTTNKGGMSYLMGATSTNASRDSVAVETFTCTSF